MIPSEEYPDKTVGELLEQDESDDASITEDELEEMKDDFEDMREGAIIHLQAASLADMFFHGGITLREYVQYVDILEEIADERGVELP